MNLFADQDESPATREIESLRREIQRHNRLYYDQAKSEISDQEYDRLYQRLIDLEKKYPHLQTPDSPTRRVGGKAPSARFASIAHALPMLSIDNTYDHAELMAWHQRLLKALPTESPDTLFAVSELTFCIEPKIDGIAIGLRYEKGVLIHAATRGDGRVGDDVTANVKTISQVPHRLTANAANAIPDVLEVRGEVFMNQADFEQLNRQRGEEEMDEGDDGGEEGEGGEGGAKQSLGGGGGFANPRNATAGTMKRIDPQEVAKRKLRFIAHGRGQVQPEIAQTHSEFLTYVQALGLPINPLAKSGLTIEQVWQEIERFRDARHRLPYGVDGMVVKVDRYDQQERLGTTSKSPRWCIAFKYAAEQAKTRLKSVTWQVGKGGTVTPVAELEPVELAGTTVKRAGLHNVDRIAELGLCINDQVLVEKAGEIIPQVVGVSKEDRLADAQPIQAPTECPSCRSPVTRAEGEAALRCNNPQCPAQIRERIAWFAGRKQMDIDGLGDKSIALLADAGLLNHLTDVYRLDQHRATLIELDRMGEKKVDNLLAAIEASKKRGLARLLAGLGIRHVGATAAKTLAEHFGDIQKMIDADENQLMDFTVDGQPSGIGPETAKSLHAFLHSSAGSTLIAELEQMGLEMTEPQRHSPNDSLALRGRVIVVTGTLSGISRLDLQAKLQSLGAKIADSVTNKTNLLIVGENPGSKLAKAQNLNIEVWDQARLQQELPQLAWPTEPTP